MTQTYISLTTGPIVETLLSARKTRELWAASYFFSHLMRRVMLQLVADGFSDDILLPSPEGADETNSLGAGLYPDRLLLRASEKLNLGMLKETCGNVVDELARNSFETFQKRHDNSVGKEAHFQNSFSEGDVRHYFRAYLKLYLTAQEVAAGDNILQRIFSVAEGLELQSRIVPVENWVRPGDERHPLVTLLYLANWSFLFRAGFAGSGKKRFDSLLEIAARELRIYAAESFDRIMKDYLEEEEEGEQPVVAQLKEAFGSKFRAYHKYVAIVHADGDNVGQIIKAIGARQERIRSFSKQMLDFSRQAARLVDEYGGAPVYFGGDDMLFLAPVVNHSGGAGSRNHLFSLLQRLETLFEKVVAAPYRGELVEIAESEGRRPKLPSLSYGVSITYYKHPLYEAKMLSHSLLGFVKSSLESKNAVNIELVRHSGRHLPLLLPKQARNGVSIWNEFNLLLAAHNTSTDFLSSFAYKLKVLEPLLNGCMTGPLAGGPRLEAFFRNNFNENYERNHAFYESLQAFILALYRYFSALTGEAVRLLYGALRFIQFVHEKEAAHEPALPH